VVLNNNLDQLRYQTLIVYLTVACRRVFGSRFWIVMAFEGYEQGLRIFARQNLKLSKYLSHSAKSQNLGSKMLFYYKTPRSLRIANIQL